MEAYRQQSPVAQRLRIGFGHWQLLALTFFEGGGKQDGLIDLDEEGLRIRRSWVRERVNVLEFNRYTYYIVLLINSWASQGYLCSSCVPGYGLHQMSHMAPTSVTLTSV